MDLREDRLRNGWTKGKKAGESAGRKKGQTEERMNRRRK